MRSFAFEARIALHKLDLHVLTRAFSRGVSRALRERAACSDRHVRCIRLSGEFESHRCGQTSVMSVCANLRVAVVTAQCSALA
jgi:hypothetical protein